MKNIYLPLLGLLLYGLPAFAQNCTANACNEVATCIAGGATVVTLRNNLDCDFAGVVLNLQGVTLDIGNNDIILDPATLVNAATTFGFQGSSEVSLTVGGTVFTFNQNGNQGADGTLAELNAQLAAGGTTLGAVVSALPVELTNYRIEPHPKYIELSWEVASESENDYFRIEQATDGADFTELLTVAGRGTATTSFVYTVRVVPSGPWTHYYRLVQRDFDGTETYLGVRSIDWRSGTDRAVVFPNPVRAGQSFVLPTSEVMRADWLMIEGSAMRTAVTEAGQRSSIRVPADWRAGVYLLRLQYLDGAVGYKRVVVAGQ